jgi:hypothetical protein
VECDRIHHRANSTRIRRARLLSAAGVVRGGCPTSR